MSTAAVHPDETRDGDVPLAQIAQDVRAAETALLNEVENKTAESWRLRDLLALLRDRWSNSIISIAFWGLVERGALEVDAQRRVHLLGAK